MSHTQVHAAVRKKVKRRETFQRLILILVLLLPILFGVYLIFKVHPVRVGDGTEYLLTTIAFGEGHEPFITQGIVDRYNDLLRREPLKGSFPVVLQNFPSVYGPPIPTREGPTYEVWHFWFMGMLTAPYYWFTQTVGLNFADSYTLFFISLWLLLVMLGYRLQGMAGAVTTTAIFILSPVLWFVNKAHTEFFTVAGVLAAVILLDTGLYLWASFTIASVATQNPALAPLAVLLLGFWIVTKRRGPYALEEVFLCAATGFLLALSPFYYFSRHGVISPLVAAGFSNSSNITFKRVISLFIDPDVGLYPNWPVGLLLIVVGVIALMRRDEWRLVLQKCRDKQFCFYLLFMCAFLVLMPLAQASQPNYNAGGTVHVSRYALWYIPLHYPLIVYLLRRAASVKISGLPLQKIAAWGTLALSGLWGIYFNVSSFWPDRTEVFQEHSPFAQFIYSKFPAVFDPVPEVFIARTGTGSTIGGPVPRGVHRVDPKMIGIYASTAFADGVWALAVPSCTKIYVLSDMVRMGRADASRRPVGCTAFVDSKKLLSLAKARQDGGDFYLNLSPSEIRGTFPLLSVGKRVVFSSPEAMQYLGEGWSAPEQGFRWTDGPIANMAFRLSGSDLARLQGHRLALRMQVAGMTLQVPVQVANVLVNGKPAGEYSWRRESQAQIRTIDIPIIPDGAGQVHLEFRIRYPLEKRTTVDTRALGLMCFSMELAVI